MKKTICGFLAFILMLPQAPACGLVYSENSSARLVTEKTLIVWNEQQKTEDFIRMPQIETDKADVGFIVPVPNIPEVSEIDNNVFNELDQLIEKLRPTEFKFKRDPAQRDSRYIGLSKGMGPPMPGARGAQVVKEYQLSKYEVKVVKADNFESFKTWLRENNYAFRPALEAWLKNYVNDRFYLTVFKFKKDDSNEGLKGQAISIKFKTDAPFYPYRDSSDVEPMPGRNLKLYFLSDKRYAPDFGERPENKPAGFIDHPEMSAKVKLKPEHEGLHFDQQSWLTVWSDTTERRPDTDLKFKVAEGAQNEILPEAKIQYLEDFIPLVIFGFMALLANSVPGWMLINLFFKTG